MRKTALALGIAFSLSALCTYAGDKPSSKVITADQVEWGYLNPLRGNKSPGAANLWGDRTKDSATGMLVRFNKGFSSPPHIHNISYRGVVIKGLMHNDDPSAQTMWMPTGSYWTQPAGEDHITSANGEENLIYLEIDSGPYLVKPSKEQFDNGERPLNLHEANMVWLSQIDVPSLHASGVQITYLWGQPKQGEVSGALLKLPANFNGNLLAKSDEFKIVVIDGGLTYSSVDNQEGLSLLPGSFVSSQGEFAHHVQTSDETTVYVRTKGSYEVFGN